MRTNTKSVHIYPMSNFKKNNFILALKNTLIMSGPIVAARVSGAINGFIVMLLIARLGHAELAAGALINSVYFSFLVPIWQLFFAVGVLVGQNYGAKQYQEIGAIVRQGLLLGVIVGIPIIFILLHIETILVFLGQDPHLAMLTQKFCNGYVWGVIPGFWFVCFGQMANGISRQKLSMIFTIAVIPLIIGIGDVLMFGRFGLPRLGISGMGYGNAAAFSIIDMAIVAYFYWQQEFKQYKIFALRDNVATHYLKELFAIGWPIALMTGAELMVFSFSTIFVGWLGESSLAAWQITLQINLVAFMFPMGIGQASTILISQEVGRKNYHTISDINYAALLLGMICTLIFCFGYWLIPQAIISLYLDIKNATNAATLHTAVILLAITAVMNIFDTLRSIAACSLRGLRDTIIPMIVFVILGCILSLPIGYVLGFPMHFGAAGVRFGFVIGFGVGAVILLLRAHKFTKSVGTKYCAPTI